MTPPEDWADAEMPPAPVAPAHRGLLSRIPGRTQALASAISLLLIVALFIGVLMWRTAWYEDQLTRPPEQYIEWQSEFFSITGQDNISGLTGDGVVICVVDTGVDTGHSDLALMNLVAWKDFVNDRPNPYDDQGHGTAMVGVIVAAGGLRGVAPGAEILVAKAMGTEGQGDDETLGAAVDWCVTEEADIISLSLGGAPGFDLILLSTDALEQSVRDALDAGVFVTAAAGNDGEDDDGDVESPGSIEDVICVGGIDRHAVIWTGSSEGDNNGRLWPPPIILPRSDPDKKPELVAPGKDVPVLIANKADGLAWGHASGTSASTAWMSGALALLLEARPDLQREGSSGGQTAINSVKDWIEETSEGVSGHDDHYGYGRLRIDSLLTAAGVPSEPDSSRSAVPSLHPADIFAERQ